MLPGGASLGMHCVHVQYLALDSIRLHADVVTQATDDMRVWLILDVRLLHRIFLLNNVMI